MKHILSVVDDITDRQRIDYALKGACDGGDRGVVEILLDIVDERDYAFVDSYFENALFDIALKKGHREIAELLFERLDAIDIAKRSYSGDIDSEEEEDEDEDEDDDDRLSSLDILRFSVSCSSQLIVDAILRVRKQKGLNSDVIYEHEYSEMYHVLCSFERNRSVLSNASDPRIIETLINDGATLNQRRCETVLRGACEKLNVDGVRALLNAGAEVNKHDVGEAALFHAVYAECSDDRVGDKIAVINLLLDAGADACKVAQGMSVLHMSGDLRRHESQMSPVINVLLDRCPALLHCKCSDGITVLMSMVHTNRPWMVKMLLDAGADPRVRDLGAKSALCHLLSGWHTIHPDEIASTREILLMLLSAGADPLVCVGRHGTGTVLMQVLSENELRLFESDKTNYTDADMSSLIAMIIDSLTFEFDDDDVALSDAEKKTHGRGKRTKDDVKSQADDKRASKRTRRR
jgi:ankyrin repeat protein